ncbi:DUF3304 domain-containing protein [Paraburkholderia acidipaludis]|uniref:DUF3304 domain-containing protein n=1 Tax=Paraburkholderia acidipaludis TaxID=660537 RepID=UPI0009FBB915|nr:DUF3304 domain-containing protein [Paraburkholderia acidipaludis]
MPKDLKRWGGFLLFACVAWIAVSRACSQETYGPYHIAGYDYTDRNIASFWVNETWGGNSSAHYTGRGGGGETCCLEIPKRAKTLHIKVVLDLTQEQDEKNLPPETYETEIPVPELRNKHDGYIEFHFLPGKKIEAKWVEFLKTPNIPNATN